VDPQAQAGNDEQTAERGMLPRTVAATVFVLVSAFALYRGLSRPSEPVSAVVLAPSVSGGQTTAADAASDALAAKEFVPAFRVSALAAAPDMQRIEGTIGKRTLLAALASAGLSVAEGTRLLRAFEGVHRFDKTHPKDAFTIVRDAAHHVVGFEYEVSPLEIYQAREVDGRLTGKKLELTVERKRVTAGILVGEDFRESIRAGGLDQDMVKRLDDALDGHLSVSDIRKNGRLKIVAIEAKVENNFARYERIEAVEYSPPRKHGKPLRIYGYAEGSGKDAKRVVHYDAKGQRPFHGGWRLPIPMARITSRFNPKRMHPVLHRVMPHNGVDFAGITGTPVYAVASGTLKFAADSGPCGNMVAILHANGLSSAYCHLSRFAGGLEVGEKVEGRQLVGYVGQTGRVTGPHLHFAVKKGNQFVDPATLKMGEVTTLSKHDRDAFAELRKALDLVLDGIQVAAGEPEDSEPQTADSDEENLDVFEEN
jgi:murein DD-endopeptidase MepM/ murein hydrolase activator NlpD